MTQTPTTRPHRPRHSAGARGPARRSRPGAGRLTPTAASAHAGLVSTSPTDGARLDTLPAQVVLTFTEDISTPALVAVTAADGTTVARREPTVDGPVVAQTLTTGPAGDYPMAYRVVSSDGHPITGEVDFTVSAGAGPSTDPSAGTTIAAPTAAAPAAGAPTTQPARPRLLDRPAGRPVSRRLDDVGPR